MIIKLHRSKRKMRQTFCFIFLFGRCNIIFMRVNKIKFFCILNNMNNIIEPNENFDFLNISLAHPSGIQGGSYFTKIEFNKKPLYIQTTKSLTRQSIVKTGKKYYTDLMFDKNSEVLINWFENLEERCKKLIYEKKDSWFEGNLEDSDIENAFNPLIRLYKTGKYYLLRTNIKNNKDDEPLVKIYNENEVIMKTTDITPETEIISILEIQGIKFTSKNFQIEIDLKQIMILDNQIFDNCVIKKNNNKYLDNKYLEDTSSKGDYKINSSVLEIESNNKIDFENININNNLNIDSQEFEINNNEVDNNNQVNNNSKLDNNKLDNNNTLRDFLDEFEPLDLEQESKEKENISLDIEFEDLTEDIQENIDELRDIGNEEFNLDINDEGIKLKKPNQVYFELYKEARNKAKQAKKNAILSYLEVKNIKKTYMIENINDNSDSDFDAEIDEASESELVGL